MRSQAERAGLKAAKAAERAAKAQEAAAKRVRPPKPKRRSESKTAGEAITELAFDLCRGAGITSTHEELAATLAQAWDEHYYDHRGRFE